MRFNGDEQVLVAEDDANDAYFIKRALKGAGISRPPHIVENGQIAIDYLQGLGEYADRSTFPFPHLILTDLKMPVASGFDLLKWLDEHPDLKAIPTVVFSSSADPHDVKRAYCLGASAYLCKPSDPVEFNDVISILLRFWETCERPPIAGSLTCTEAMKNRN